MTLSPDHYLNFILNALRASTSAVDAYYLEHKSSIEAYASLLNEKYPCPVTSLYRGILLEEDIDLLPPLDHIQFLSFSEDRNVAYNFADIDSDISQFMKAQSPNAKGYVIEYTPEKDEILFHHSWVDCLGLDWYLHKASIDLLREQKEVTLKQSMKEFKLKRYDSIKKATN